MSTCPKCNAARDPADTTCPQCGVIYAKVPSRSAANQQQQPSTRPSTSDVVESVALHHRPTRATLTTTCPDCAGTVSRNAHSCPHCGSPLADGGTPVYVTDVHMAFRSMVWFMVKWAIASIPAIIILAVIGLAISAVLGGLAAGLTHR